MVRKVSLLRRITDKFPTITEGCINNIRKYQEFFQKGTENSKAERQNLNDYAKGPIGLLAEDLHKYGAALNSKFEIIQEDELPIHISNTPWQELKRLVEQVAKRKRIKDVFTRRNYLEQMEEFA